MGVNDQDVRALDILAKSAFNPEYVKANKINENDVKRVVSEMGVDYDDVRAWHIATTGKLTPDESDEIKAKVLDKVRTQKTVEKNNIDAFIQGGLQGLSFNSSDEAIAFGKALYQKAKKGGDFKKLYEDQVKKERAELKELEERFPLQFIAGELGGALLVPIPGATALKSAGVTSKLVSKYGLLAVESALQSAGKSEAEYLSKQFLEDVAKGTIGGVTFGALLNKGGEKAIEYAQKGLKPFQRAAKVVSSVLFDLPPAYTERLIDPKTTRRIIDPKSADDIVESIVDMTSKMSKHAKALSLKATSELSDKKVIDVKDVIDNIGTIERIKNITRSTLPESQAAQKRGTEVLEDLINRSNNKDMVSEVDLKRFVQDLDNEVPWNKNEWKLKDNILGDIRKFIDSNYLKNNATYADQMVPVDRLMNNIKDISKSFSLKRKGYSLKPTDATYSKVNSFFNVAGISKKPMTEKALIEAEGRFLGPAKPNILEDIELRQIATRTEGGMPAGSKHILTGLALGSLFGSPTFGVIAGAVKDRYGRASGKFIVPKLSGVINWSDKALQNRLDKINPEILSYLLRETGRYTGSMYGLSASQEPRSLLPNNQKYNLIPQK